MAYQTHGMDFVFGPGNGRWQGPGRHAEVLTLVDLIENLTDVLRPLGGSILDLDQSGPGGGNPMVTFLFQTKDGAAGFMEWYDQDQGETEFLMELLTEV